MFKVGKLAQLLGVHRNTVTNWIKSGKLKANPAAAKKYVLPRNECLDFCTAEKIPPEISGQVLHAFLEIDTSVEASSGAGGIPAGTPAQPLQLPRKTLGSVLVLGGGIAAIQATLDLLSPFRVIRAIRRYGTPPNYVKHQHILQAVLTACSIC